MTEAEKWILGCTIIMAVASIAAVIISIVAMNRKQEVQVQQPVSVTITEELHKIFASKEAFDNHLSENKREHETFASKGAFDNHLTENKREHENIFSKIGGVERGAIKRMDEHLGAMQKSAEEGRERIHKRLNRISVGLANLCGRIGAQMPAEEEEL